MMILFKTLTIKTFFEALIVNMFIHIFFSLLLFFSLRLLSQRIFLERTTKKLSILILIGICLIFPITGINYEVRFILDFYLGFLVSHIILLLFLLSFLIMNMLCFFEDLSELENRVKVDTESTLSFRDIELFFRYILKDSNYLYNIIRYLFFILPVRLVFYSAAWTFFPRTFSNFIFCGVILSYYIKNSYLFCIFFVIFCIFLVTILLVNLDIFLWGMLLKRLINNDVLETIFFFNLKERVEDRKNASLSGCSSFIWLIGAYVTFSILNYHESLFLFELSQSFNEHKDVYTNLFYFNHFQDKEFNNCLEWFILLKSFYPSVLDVSYIYIFGIMC